MGDLGWNRRQPRGWVPGTARARTFRIFDPDRSTDSGETVIDPADHSWRMDVEWDVEVAGHGPFAVREEDRKAPLWVDASSPLVGRGRRFWSVTVRETHGLLPVVAVPCLVDPRTWDRIWIDWDEAYSRHVPEWDRMTAVRREVTMRKGGIDAVGARLTSRFRPKLDPADEHLVTERLAAERAEWDEAVAATEAAARAGDDPSIQDHLDRHERLTATGRRAAAMIVSAEPTGRQLHGLPEWAIELDVHDGAETRRVVHHEPLGRPTSPWTPGLRTQVRIDPADPDQLTFA